MAATPSTPAPAPAGPSADASPSPWAPLALAAVFGTTVCLIAVGSLVTTLRAGMAVPDWPTSFGYGMFEYPVAQWLFGPQNILVEHGHRLLGSLVGMLMIAAVAAVWLGDRRGWMRWLSVVGLFLVVFQGLLGGLRVVLNQQLLAAVHGAVAPAFLGLTAALLAAASRDWRRTSEEARRNLSATPSDGESVSPNAAATGGAWLLVTLVYTQIVLGAALRHFPSRAAAWGHVPLAFVLAGMAVWHWRMVRRDFSDSKTLLKWSSRFAALTLAQWALGLAVWVAKYGWEGYTVVAYGTDQVFSLLGHVVLGDFLLGVAVYQAMLLSRRAWAFPAAPPAGGGPALESPSPTLRMRQSDTNAAAAAAV